MVSDIFFGDRYACLGREFKYVLYLVKGGKRLWVTLDARNHMRDFSGLTILVQGRSLSTYKAQLLFFSRLSRERHGLERK
jgi:hypothetical protein